MSSPIHPLSMMTEATLLDKIFHSTPGRILVSVLQTVLGSVLLLLVTPFWKAGAPILLKYLIVVGLGLWAGFSARGLLKSRTQILKLLTAWASAALSLAALSILSGGFLGFKLVNDQGQTPDWSGLAPVRGRGCRRLACGPGLPSRSRGRTQPGSPSRPPGSQARSPAPDQGESHQTEPTHPETGRPQSRPGDQKNPSQKEGRSPAGKTKARQKTAPLTAAKAKAQAPAPEARSTKKAFKEIKFIGAAEHTCPYCLDPVIAHDPRGVKVCPICKTQHHADCWGITGACQIPHAH